MLNDMETKEDIDELVVEQNMRKKKLLRLLQAARAEGVATECIEQTSAVEVGGGGGEALTAGETADRMIMQIHDVEEAEHKSRKSSQEKLLKRRSRKDPSLLVEHSVRHTAALEEQRATEAAEARERLAARRARESPRRQTPRYGVGESSDG